MTSLPRFSNPFRSPLFPSIFSMTLPVMAEQAFITLMGIVNAGMAGRAGTAIAGGVSLVNPLNNMLIYLFSSASLGVSVAVSRARGSGNEEQMRLAASQSLTIAFAFSAVASIPLILFAAPVVDLLFGASDPVVRANAVLYLRWVALGYPLQAVSLAASGALRGAGDAKTPMVANIVMNFFNALFGSVLIFGFGAGGTVILEPMGAKGAAIAIDLARLIGFGIYMAMLFAFSPRLRLSPRRLLAVDGESRKTIFQVAIPSSIESLAFNGGKLLTQTYVAGFGAAALSADYIANAVVALEQVPVSSLSMAVPPLVALSLGKKDRNEARELVKVASLAGSLVMLALAVPSIVFARPILGLSTDDPEVIRQAANLFILFSLTSPFFWAVSFVVPGGLRGAGDGRYTMVVALLSMWLVRVVLGWFLSIPLHMGILGVWIAMVCDWVVRGIWFTLRMSGTRWVKI